MDGYSISFSNNTITITADFAKKMNNPTSKEFKTIAQIKKDFPKMEIVRRSHKSPSKYHTKSGETFNCNQFKNLTYDKMERFIKGLPNNVEILKSFNYLKKCASSAQTAPYTVVRRWFVAQFPDFRTNPLYYLYNDVDVIDIKPFLQKGA